jgi:hypothetical protein
LAAVGAVLLAVGGLLVLSGIHGKAGWEVVAAGSVAGGVGGLLLQVGKSLAAKTADEALRDDPRPPVLLLRAFDDDRAYVEFESGSQRQGNSLPHTPYTSEQFFTFEEAVADALAAVGPVVAIGRPGEVLAPVGAARTWVGDDAWQAKVTDYLRQCGLVVLFMGRIGGGKGLAWELRTVLDTVPPEKVIFVLPPVGEDEARTRWESFREHSGGLLPPYEPGALAAGFDTARTCTVARDLLGAAPPGERYARAVLSLVRPDRVETLVVRFAPLRSLPAATRVAIAAALVFPWLILAAAFTAPTPAGQVAVVAPCVLAWTGLFGLLLYVQREKVLRVGPDGLSYAVRLGHRRYAWGEVATVRDLEFEVRTPGGGRETRAVPEYYGRSCPRDLIARVLARHWQTVRSR